MKITLLSSLSLLVAMARWNAADLVKEINDLDVLNTARSGSAIIEKMASQIVGKIDQLPDISASQLIHISEGINASGLPESIKHLLLDSLDARALKCSNGCLTTVAKSQTLTTVFNYLSQKEYAEVSSAPLPTMVHTICQRLKKCGVRSMKEKTKSSSIAFILHLMTQRGEARPPPVEVYNMGKYFANAFAACDQTGLAGGYGTYPSTPAELGDVP